MLDPVCWHCGCAATIKLRAEYPMGMSFAAVHYEQRDEVVKAIAYACAAHAGAVAAELDGPTVPKGCSSRPCH